MIINGRWAGLYAPPVDIGFIAELYTAVFLIFLKLKVNNGILLHSSYENVQNISITLLDRFWR